MRYLVTSALPYANGPLHFGHIAGAYLPADIFVRFKRLRREDVIYICGTDEHGTPITFNAGKEGITPLAYADRWHEVIKRQFDRLDIVFDNFSRTTKKHHYDLTQQFFTTLKKNGYVFDQLEKRLYCETCKKGLADRFVLGTCYVCGFERARGDECPKCGTALDELKIQDPRCKTCGKPAVVRDSRNWYVDLPKLRPKLEPYITDAFTRWKDNVKGEVNKYWLDLRPWVVTRDLDWGVPVPLPEAKDKVFYVWFDAPIGYISSTIEWSRDGWKDWWFDRANTRLIHFIGKDNIAFHAVRWPAMLLGQTDPYLVPYDVPANEFYNLEGGKFSTSEGWYIDFDEFLDRYPQDALRWTIARGAPETRDSEFTWKDFQAKVNAELLGNFGNFASGLGGGLERQGVRSAAEHCLKIGYAGNKLFEQREPWKTIKTDPDRCATTLHVAAKILEVLCVALSPFIPRTADRLWTQLGLPGSPRDRGWKDAREPSSPGGRKLGPVELLFKKIEDADVEREVAALRARATKKEEKPQVDDKKPAAPAPTPGTGTPPPAAAKPAEGGPKADIAFDDFGKLDIKVAKVLTCVPVEGADKLFKLEVEIDGGQKRTVVSGIRPWYKEEELVGREVVYLANLAPKKLRGVLSQGMILAAHSQDGGAVLLKPEKGVFPGSKVS